QPNGNPAPGPKKVYKLAWIKRLEARARDLLATEEIALMAGDYNVIPQDEDCHDPKVWAEDALFRPETRAAWRRLLALGYTEAFRALNAAPLNYTFWDYQAGAWNKNNGIRIDHFLLTPQAADRLSACEIDKSPRGKEKPSDHTPIWVELDI
ncbi:MAG: exodeoxyribonuclease III, partial [Pseudomonadota bacterium]